MRAVVVGSLNMDLVLSVPALPSRGQTLLSRSRDRLPGGKGANQAVALSRLGAGVAMVGAVGHDPDGAELLAALEAAGVSTRHVSRRPLDPTGLAVVCVAPDGDNAIVVASGANATLTPGDLATAARALSGAGLLLLQLEIPLDTVQAAARAGRDHGVLVVLNAAPATRRHMLDFLAAIETRGRSIADIEEGHISTASCILANLSMKLGRRAG